MTIKKQNEVVISGIGAKLPESSNVKEFCDKLYSKSVLIKSDFTRWIPAVMDKPFTSGRIPDADRFDYTFFGISSKLVHNCDPQMAQMLERSYEAIVDAGVNPVTLKGHNICVVSCTSMGDAEIVRGTGGKFLDGYGMVGHSRTMMANRISYCFNFMGPSYNINTSWASAVQGLEIAASLVAQGLCEAAIVTGSNLLYLNSVEKEYTDLNLLAPDGKCLPFDINASGFVRSEATVSFFLQRAQEAKRHYCTLLKSEVRCLAEEESYIKLPPTFSNFYKNFYKNCKVNPIKVSYVEAFGCCTKDTDAQELNAVSHIFGDGISQTLVGSVTGNVGNTECCAGFVSLIKAIIAMETGIIPPTIGNSIPNPHIPAFVSGQLKLVTEPTSLYGDLIAVNCLNITANVGHVLIRKNKKSKNNFSLGDLSPDRLPRLVILQSRHEEGIRYLIDKLSKMPVDTEYISLINSIFKSSVSNYLWRSYITLPVSEFNMGKNKVEQCSTKRRPLWLVFSGMGSQWSGMGTDLLKIPLFCASIERCDKVLAPHGINIRNILTADSPKTFDNILNCFVGIATIQVGLVDILRAVGIVPDGIIGHSVGELGCAYADGCLTAEELVLAAYFRGKASLESQNISGMMAAVGLGYNDIKDQVPPTIDVACHNSATSCTLSGPTNDVLEYVEELKNKKVFAKAVNSGGVAYHSRYIRKIGHKLITYLKQVIKKPKPRSPKWISTSVPEAQWNTPEAKMCSAEYHTNNLLSPVLFEEGLNFLPDRVILLEIAPHGLLQSILRRSVSNECISLSLTNRNSGSNSCHVLDILGRLHNEGFDVDVNSLYPPVQYPVSRGTPSLADLVTWDHSEKLFHGVQELCQMTMKGALEVAFEINQKNPEYNLWKDYCINGNVIVPLSQLLIYAWNRVFKAKRLDINQESVIIEQVFISDVIYNKNADYTITVSFSPASFQFEVCINLSSNIKSNIILKGHINKICESIFKVPKLSKDLETIKDLTESEIYSLLASYGWHLGSKFQLIKKVFIKEKACIAQVQWTGNMVTFLDALFKIVVSIHSEKEQRLMQLSYFSRITINPRIFGKYIPDSLIDVYYDLRSKRLVCEAVELCGIILSPASSAKLKSICWREVKIQAHMNIKRSIDDFLSTCVQLASQTNLNLWSKNSYQLHIIVLPDNNGPSGLLIKKLNDVTNSFSNLSVKLKELESKDAIDYMQQIGSQACLCIGQHNIIVDILEGSILSNIFCISYSTNNSSLGIKTMIRCIMSYQTKRCHLSLLKRKSFTLPLQEDKVFEVENRLCLERLDDKMAEDTNHDHVVVVSSTMTPRHLLPILANKRYANRLCTVFILDNKAPKLSLSSPIYKNEIAIGLPVNILCGGSWGTLLASDIDVSPQKKNVDRFFYSSAKNLEVYCIGLNLKNFTLNQEWDNDKMKLTCADYSGYTGEERVMGVAQCNSVFYLTPDSTLRWSVPQGWTFDEAVTVPVLYTMAYYCVLVKGQVKPGEDVLVHAGMSPIGQAVIAVALQIGANVITSVTSDEEAIDLLKEYPLVKPSHVLVLGSQDIFVVVSKLTAGKGVKVIVSCLRGSDMKSSIKTMGHYGRFLHLGRIEIEDKESIGLLVFLRQTSFFGVSLEDVTTCSHETKELLQKAVENGLNEGVVKPLKKTTFNFKDEKTALMHLRNKNAYEKTVLTIDTAYQLLPKRIEGFCFTSDQTVIILGTLSELWIDAAEWMVQRGLRCLVVFLEDNADNMMSIDTSRFSRLINKFNTTFYLMSKSRLNSITKALKVLEEVQKIGDIANIICIKQDESCNAMRNLDLASRKLLPELPQFVSLLGEGAVVSESRAASGLPVCSIQCELPLKNPSQVLPYLSTLPANAPSRSHFYVVSDYVNSTETQDNSKFQSLLSLSLDELCQLGDIVSEIPVFSEEATLSPGYRYTRHSLLPVFVISGFNYPNMKHLIRQIIHPAFCSSLPASITSVNDYTQMLLHGILKIQKQGSFNLVASTWEGPVALTVANLLEARGYNVKLCLLDVAPIFIQDSIRNLCENDSPDIGPILLAETLKPPAEVLKRISQYKSWDEQLKFALLEVKVNPGLQHQMAKGLTYIYNQFDVLLRHETPINKLHGNLTLITYKPVSQDCKERLLQICESLNIVMIEDDSPAGFLANINTASEINKNIAYDWNL